MEEDQDRDWETILDPDKLISKRQYGMIKAICSNECLVRAESVARDVIGKDLLELDQIEAHEVIQYLEKYSSRQHRFSFEDLDRELGRALINFKPQDNLISTDTRVLCLLALNRVATPGQVARYVFGLVEACNNIRERAELLLERMAKGGSAGCERAFGLMVRGKSVKADIYYLTESGSDLLHEIAPCINYYARPGLPRRDRIYHDLCVLEARLDLQSHKNVIYYEPETQILSEQQKERNRRNLIGEGPRGNIEPQRGCGDFRGLFEDPLTRECRKVEVEVVIRGRGGEISGKPGRITHYYAASLHQCFLIELHQNKFAKLVPNVLAPLTEDEEVYFRAKANKLRATVSEERVSKVRAALEKMGGVATPEAIATIAGIKNTTASEALALLGERGEILCRDGFPITGKMQGRNLRLYFRKGFTINSIYEFGRLLTASKVISGGLISQEYKRILQPVAFDSTTGVMVLKSAEKDLPVIAVIDDPSESPERVFRWAEAAHQEASEIFYKEQVLIATYGRERTEQLRAMGDYKVLDVESIATQVAVNNKNEGHRKRNKRQRKAAHSPKAR